MGTTTNNGWPTPVATDLVKDGWEAIKDLGDAIDTTLGVYSPATPMGVHLSTVTFSAVASQSVNDVFSATYQNYIISFSATAASGGIPTLKLRVSGTDASSAYSSSVLLANWETGASSVANSANSSSWSARPLGCLDATNTLGGTFMTLFSPFETRNTAYSSSYIDARVTTTNGAGAGGGVHNSATSYTGFTIANTSNMTGTVRVYGLAN